MGSAVWTLPARHDSTGGGRSQPAAVGERRARPCSSVPHDELTGGPTDPVSARVPARTERESPRHSGRLAPTPTGPPTPDGGCTVRRSRRTDCRHSTGAFSPGARGGGRRAAARPRVVDPRHGPLRVGPYYRHAKRMPDVRCIGRVGSSGADIDVRPMARYGAFRCHHRWVCDTVVGVPSFSVDSPEDSGPSVLPDRAVQSHSAGTGGATDCRGSALSSQSPSPAPSRHERTRPGRATVP